MEKGDNMNNIKEKQIEEAVKRLKLLDFSNDLIKTFVTENKPFISDTTGFIRELNGKEINMVKEWESDTGNVVYHLIENIAPFGANLSFLYVSKFEDEWYMDCRDLLDCLPIVYVENLTFPDCSEYGSISIYKALTGGLIRKG